MSVCNGKISRNFVRECSYAPKSGLGNIGYLINTEDIDKSATQLSAGKMKITELVLKEGSKLYSIEAVNKFPQATSEVVKGDYVNGWKHGFNVPILYYGEDEREELQNMLNSGRITVITKHKDSGKAGELTYQVLGYESGLAVQAIKWSSAENSGVVQLELATEEGEEESTDRKILLKTDLATTEALLTANLAPNA